LAHALLHCSISPHSRTRSCVQSGKTTLIKRLLGDTKFSFAASSEISIKEESAKRAHSEEHFWPWRSRRTSTVHRQATDGINVHPWIPPNTSIFLYLWDFAGTRQQPTNQSSFLELANRIVHACPSSPGQSLYYGTHEFFLNEKAVYALVFNICEPLENVRLVHWLNTLQVRHAIPLYSVQH